MGTFRVTRPPVTGSSAGPTEDPFIDVLLPITSELSAVFGKDHKRQRSAQHCIGLKGVEQASEASDSEPSFPPLFAFARLA